MSEEGMEFVRLKKPGKTGLLARSSSFKDKQHRSFPEAGDKVASPLPACMMHSMLS